MTIYEPLNQENREIRILLLLPSEQPGLVRARLQTLSLNVFNQAKKGHSSHDYARSDDSVGSDSPVTFTTAVQTGLLQAAAIADIAKLLGVSKDIVEPVAQSHDIANTVRSLINALEELHAAKEWKDRDWQSWRLKYWSSVQDAAVLLHEQRMAQSRYEAVSYCWDRKNARAATELNGAMFDAPASAVEVLKRFSKDYVHPALWIDALCINQQDMKERESQILMMGDIYRFATRTLVWLGPEDVQTTEALDVCRALLEQLPKDVMDLPTGQFRHALQNIHALDDASVKSLDHILYREWFTRQWVLQEVAPSKQHVCFIGSETIGWRDLELLNAWAYETRQWERLRRIPELPCMTLSIRRGAPVFQNLSALALQSRKLLATNSRDKIYGLLSMARWEERGEPPPEAVRPNYEQSLSSCMCRATKAMIEEDQNLFVLEEVEVQWHDNPTWRYDLKECDLPWPSWCPQWHRPKSETQAVIPRLGSRSYAEPRTRDATTAKWSGLKPCQDLRTLMVAGFSIDTIFSSRTTYDLTSMRIKDGVLQEDFFADHAEAGSHPSISLATIVEVLTAGQVLLPEEYGVNFEERSFGDYKRDGILKCPTKLDPEKSYGNVSAQISVDPSAGRHMFLTSTGRIGLGSSKMRSCDKVVVLYGSAWPFVLSAEEDGFRLVGACNVQGITNDGTIAECERKGRARESFELR
ncbi:Heterokaryon incompatibility protein 6, OR allele [Pseudocercospora fuligena]|uniref:Heterokaryon incompatibility protein 6, OR allele n=1 Tax=Pseudocercospora fuligena TaxID=685502 RepID=A0A8H6RAV0_9PEZI|nr:Heterokaryon incompatibility protein 6, OR allele [Pseudocercospora fuligena]